MARCVLLFALLLVGAGAFQAHKKAAVRKAREGQMPDFDSIIDSAQGVVSSASDVVSEVAGTVNSAVDVVNDTAQAIQDVLNGANITSAATNTSSATNTSDATTTSNATNTTQANSTAVENTTNGTYWATSDAIYVGAIRSNMSAAEVSAGVAGEAAVQLDKAREAYLAAEFNASRAAEVGMAAAKVLAERANETTEASNAAIAELANALEGGENLSVVEHSVQASKSADAAVAAAGMAVAAVTEYNAFKQEAAEAAKVSMEAAKLVADGIEKTVSSSRDAERALQEDMLIFEKASSPSSQEELAVTNLTDLMNSTKSNARDRPLPVLGVATAFVALVAGLCGP